MSGIWSDPESNALYFLLLRSDGRKSIVLFDTPVDFGDQYYRTYNWKSKIFVSNQGTINLAAARVRMEEQKMGKMIITVYSYRAHTINGASFNELDVNGPVDMSQMYSSLDNKSSVMFIYYVDGIPRMTKLVKNSAPFRLPSGFKGDTVEVEVESSSTIRSIELASSMGELM